MMNFLDEKNSDVQAVLWLVQRISQVPMYFYNKRS